MRIYKCPICGNVVDLLEVGGGELVCCGQPMVELEAKTSEEGYEKHIPVVEVSGRNVMVTVGSVLHPMIDNHYISKIFLVYSNKVLRFDLKPSNEPKISVELDEEVTNLEVYEYCTVHDLWKTTYTK